MRAVKLIKALKCRWCTSAVLYELLQLRMACSPDRRIFGFLPSSAAVPKVDGGLIEQCVEVRPVGFSHAGRNQRSFAADAFGVQRRIFFRDARLRQSSHKPSRGSTRCSTDSRCGNPAGGDHRTQTGNSEQTKHDEIPYHEPGERSARRDYLLVRPTMRNESNCYQKMTFITEVKSECRSAEAALPTAKLFRCFEFRRAARYPPYCRHHLIYGRLLDHVAVSGNSMKLALRNFRMQPGRLRVDVDQSILLACNDRRRASLDPRTDCGT